MSTARQKIESDGYCILPQAFSSDTVQQLLFSINETLAIESSAALAKSSRGNVYAARNLIDSITNTLSLWQVGPMFTLLDEVLGEGFGLVRVLFFDKPPERTWNLPWHKDTSIAVRDHSKPSRYFSRPTTKAGVPHVIAHDDILRQMLTMRIHLDQVTDENGPLRLIPGSHGASDSEGQGLDTAVTIHAEVGDVLAMRPLISHASGPSQEGTQRHRRVLHLEFAAAEPLPDGYQWHAFERGLFPAPSSPASSTGKSAGLTC